MTLCSPVTARSQSVAPSQPAAPAQGPTAGWQDGFFLQTPGGDYRLALGFVGQMDGRFMVNDSLRTVSDTFTIRKARPVFTGRIGRYFDFRFMPDFGNGQAVLFDAYFDVRFSPAFRVRTGKDKSPVGYEILVGDPFLLFPERSLASNLMPNRDVGIQAQGDLAGNRLFYAVGLMNGIPDGTNSTTDLDANDGKDVLGRIVANPWRRTATSTTTVPGAMSGLGVALGASTGTQDGPLPAFRTSAGQIFFSYSGAVANGRRTRVTPAVFYYHKSFGGYAEFMRSSQRLSNASTTLDASNYAWDFNASWILTGEAASDRAVRPRNNFDSSAGQWGAFQLIARYAQLVVDQSVFDAGLAAPGASRIARSFTVGSNWYPNPFIKFYATFERTVFDDVGDSARESQNLILFRSQIAF